MRVYTFYNPFARLGDATPLINLWRESWERQGWKTQLLSEKDAADHPDYVRFCKTVDAFPTVNPPEYERACYVRWLAIANQDDSISILTDYDVINRTFSPKDAEKLFGNDTNVLMLEPTRVPCAVLGTPRGFAFICDELESYVPTLSDRHKGKPHVSDMEILRKCEDLPCESICIEHLCSGEAKRDHLGDGWKKAPLIHFSTYSFVKQGAFHRGAAKDVLIKNALAQL